MSESESDSGGLNRRNRGGRVEAFNFLLEVRGLLLSRFSSGGFGWCTISFYVHYSSLGFISFNFLVIIMGFDNTFWLNFSLFAMVLRISIKESSILASSGVADLAKENLF